VATCSGVGEEAERRARRRPALLNALERRAAREKEGVSSMPCGGRIGAEREGPGCGAA
jgi:hypothetical protein